MSETRHQGFSIIGIGAAACVACCAGPILAFLGGLTLAGVASTLVIGTSGLVVAGLALVAFLLVRQRRPAVSCQTTPSEPEPVALPTRRVKP